MYISYICIYTFTCALANKLILIFFGAPGDQENQKIKHQFQSLQNKIKNVPTEPIKQKCKEENKVTRVFVFINRF